MRGISSACLNADVDVAEAVVALQKRQSGKSNHIKSNHVLTESREQKNRQRANKQALRWRRKTQGRRVDAWLRNTQRENNTGGGIYLQAEDCDGLDELGAQHGGLQRGVRGRWRIGECNETVDTKRTEAKEAW